MNICDLGKSLLSLKGYVQAPARSFVAIFDAAQVPIVGAVPVLLHPVGDGVINLSWGDYGRPFPNGAYVVVMDTLTYTQSSYPALYDAQYF
jgi:hypothetical protein